MNINRNNYEEFFLLYADNELCAAEKKMVDDFVAINPDLAEELVMLQQSILKPDLTAFANKESLYRHTIEEDKTTEKLLLMLDGELGKSDKKSLLDSIQTNDAVKKEWELLQQTKLPQEQIIFKDKASLYRKEAGKVVVIKWWRIAAAAVLIGFGIWGAVSYVNNGSKQGDLVKEETPSVKPSNSLPVTNEPAPSIKEQQNIEQQSTATVEEKKEATPVEPARKEATVQQQPLIVKEQKNIVQQKENKNEIKKLPQPSLEKINNEESNNQDVVIVPTVNDNIKNNIQQPANLDNLPEVKTQDVAQVTYIDMDDPATNAAEDDDRKGRGKLAGFFKKVKRSIARKANIGGDGDHDLRIANMSFASH